MTAPRLQEEKALNNKYILSTYSDYPALIFIGPPDFIERSKNLCCNYGIRVRGEIELQFGVSNWYILAPEERMINGIKSYFRGETITHHDEFNINYRWSIDAETDEITVDWDDELVDKIANERTEDFWANHVERKNILKPYQKFEPDPHIFVQCPNWQDDDEGWAMPKD